MKAQIKTDQLEFHSSTWFAIKEYYTARLSELRLKNDATQSIESTERLRGQIYEIKQLLSIEEETAGD